MGHSSSDGTLVVLLKDKQSCVPFIFGRFTMKKTLAAAAALLLTSSVGSVAADMAVKAPMLAPTPISTWTGFYVGGHVGAGWGTTESALTSITGPGLLAAGLNLPIAQNSRSGILGGGQVGYNFESGWAVFGVQGDIAGMDVKGTTPCLTEFSCTAKSDWLATVSGRVGGVVADRTLVYAKAGAAWLHTEHSFSVPNLSGLGMGGGFGGFAGASTDTTALGWLIGFGAEYAFTRNWSAFIEYDYMDFERKNAALNLTGLGGAGVPVVANVNFQNKLSIAKVGANYKF